MQKKKKKRCQKSVPSPIPEPIQSKKSRLSFKNTIARKVQRIGNQQHLPNKSLKNDARTPQSNFHNAIWSKIMTKTTVLKLGCSYVKWRKYVEHEKKYIWNFDMLITTI